MTGESRIPDDETLYRRVPPGPSWIEGNRLTSGNFALRTNVGETGVSVSRASRTSPGQLLAMVEAPAGWRVASVLAGEIRKLGLDVVSKATADDPAHAEIVPAEQPLSQGVRRRLAKKFRLIAVERPC